MAEALRLGNLVIDRDRYSVRVGEEPVSLTFIEFELLAALARNPGRVLSPQDLTRKVWGTDGARASRRLAVHMSRLRKKIAGSAPWTIRTVKKRGYSLSELEAGSGRQAAGARRLAEGLEQQRATS